MVCFIHSDCEATARTGSMETTTWDAVGWEIDGTYLTPGQSVLADRYFCSSAVWCCRVSQAEHSTAFHQPPSCLFAHYFKCYLLLLSIEEYSRDYDVEKTCTSGNNFNWSDICNEIKVFYVWFWGGNCSAFKNDFLCVLLCKWFRRALAILQSTFGWSLTAVQQPHAAVHPSVCTYIQLLHSTGLSICVPACVRQRLFAYSLHALKVGRKARKNNPHFLGALDEPSCTLQRDERRSVCAYVCVETQVRGRKSVGISNECIVTFYLAY